MTIYEPECVSMKRRGAKYVATLLAGKSRQEELEFWIMRSKKLLAKQKQKPQIKEIISGSEQEEATLLNTQG